MSGRDSRRGSRKSRHKPRVEPVSAARDSLVADLIASRGMWDSAGLGALSTDRQVLWVLYLAKTEASRDWLNAVTITRLLVEVWGVALTRQAVQGALGQLASTRLVARRGMQPLEFQIMASGIELIGATNRRVLLVEPESAHTSLKEIQAILNEVNGVVRICDPYVDGQIFAFLALVPATDLRLLTVNVKSPVTFRHEQAMFNQQFGKALETRRLNGGKLHDRYVIGDSSVHLFGTSFNGLGKKQSIVVSAGVEIRQALIDAFDRNWHSATPV